MNAPDCRRERDVIAAIVAGRWPQDSDELREHARQCEVCRDIAEVAGLLRLDREEFVHDGSIPSAGQIWWRAAIRARVEASQQAARPLSWLFGISVACAAGLGIAVVELLWSPAQRILRSVASSAWIAWSGDLSRWLPSLTDLTPFTSTGVFILLGAAACLVLAPLALYFALSDE